MISTAALNAHTHAHTHHWELRGLPKNKYDYDIYELSLFIV